MDCLHAQAVLQGQAPHVDPHTHIAGCGDCTRMDRELAAVDAMAGELPELEVPEELAEDTLLLLEELLAVDALPELRPPSALLLETLSAVDLERRAEGLPEIATPAELVARTRRAMEAELTPKNTVVRGPWGRRAVAGLGVLAAAAVATFVVLPDDQVVDTSQLVERGVGMRSPEVALKIAVDQGGQMQRLSRSRSYDVGDTLYFRAQVDQPAWVALVRVDEDGAALIHSQTMAPGEQDLQLQGGPLAWRIEAGESSATYALLAMPEAPGDGSFERALGSLSGTQDICGAAQELGARCEASPVHVAGTATPASPGGRP